ncbi:hypothetical protein [Francisella salina]|uniref:Peptidase C58 YopT-type domain-containing protein n=1 Tax=Francisella salina TaxID=573569 RepID=A0ABN3ZP57_FRAST|nr:hypothetical protein [Francisella salina]AEI36824.1 hypothetical protein F7308_1900 [Francisella salina]
MINLYYDWSQEEITKKLQNKVREDGVCHGLAALLFRYVRHYKKLPKQSRWNEVVNKNHNFIVNAQNFQKLEKISDFYGKVQETIAYKKYDESSSYDQFIYLSDYICKGKSDDIYLVGIPGHVTVLVKMDSKIYYFDPNIGLLGCEFESTAVKRLLLYVWTQKGYGISEHVLRAKLCAKRTKHKQSNSEKLDIWDTRQLEYNYTKTGNLNGNVPLKPLATRLEVKRLSLGNIDVTNSKVSVNWPFSYKDERVDTKKFDSLLKLSIPDYLKNINKGTLLNKQLEHQELQLEFKKKELNQLMQKKASWGPLGNDTIINLLMEKGVYDQKNAQQQIEEIKKDYEECTNSLYIDVNQYLTVSNIINNKDFGWRFNCEHCNLIKGKRQGITVGRGSDAFFKPHTPCCEECQFRINSLKYD